MSNAETTVSPRVWIGSLAAYNAGQLVGEWVDATDLEAMEAVAAKLPGEEYALMDREGFGGLIDEYTALDTVAAIAEALEEHGEAFRLYVENEGYSLGPEDVQSCVGDFEEAYVGERDSFREYAEEFVSEVGWGGLEQIPDELWGYLDFEMIARDLEHDHWSAPADGAGVHIFRSI